MKPLSLHLVVCALLLVSCSNPNTSAQAQGQKISQFNRAGWCDFLIDKNGIYHAVFQETPAIGKPVFIYYATSANKGVTWSKPVTLSNDNTGNGAGYPRILQDGSGKIYAIWKRYGNTASHYPKPDDILDGPGGYTAGTIFYKVLNGGTWSEPVQLNEMEQSQVSWFATVGPNGNVYVFWTQVLPEMAKAERLTWYYADYLRVAMLSGTAHSAYTDLSTPSQPTYAGGYPAKNDGALNLNGYIDNAGKTHMIYSSDTADVEQIKYFDGSKQRVVYSYPAYKAGNTWNNPPRLLVDENGTDHLIFLPSPATLESEQVWDINLATNKTNVLVQIQKEGVKINGFQAAQGPKGAMAVTFEAGNGGTGNTEAYGLFYSNGKWTNVGLTNNAAKEKFFYKEFTGLGGYRTSISTLTTYHSTFASVAYDAAGRKSLLMNIDAYSVGLGVSSPSLVYLPVDR